MIHSIVCELCGCKVYQDNDASCYITYCAVHHSAPRLYEACKEALEKSHNPEVERILMEALAEVEKK